MDCCHFRWLTPSFSRGVARPATPLPFSSAPSPYIERQQSTPHRGHHRHRKFSNSPERVHLIPKHHRRPHSMPGPGSIDVDQITIFEKGKRYQVTISNRELKWEHLQEYLELEFEGLKVPNQQRKVSPALGGTSSQFIMLCNHDDQRDGAPCCCRAGFLSSSIPVPFQNMLTWVPALPDAEREIRAELTSKTVASS